MKNFVIYISMLLISLTACQEREVLPYMEKDGLQFNYDTAHMSSAYDFMQQAETKNGRPYYYGDDLLRDTIYIQVSVMGFPGVENREFALKTVYLEGEDSTATPPVEFMPSYTFTAGRTTQRIAVAVVRPQIRMDYTVGITFDLEQSDPMFELGVEEQAVYRLRVSNRYPEPPGWDRFLDYLGEYTEEKYAFLVTTTHNLFNSNLSTADWISMNKTLRTAVDQYNQQHEVKLDFTFPVYTKPEWWEQFANYLGEFSEAKRKFIYEQEKEYWIAMGMDEDQFNQFGGYMANWREIVTDLRAKYDRWNAAHPDDLLPFPQFPDPGTSAPEWWSMAAPYIGEFSQEKMDFIYEQEKETLKSVGINDKQTLNSFGYVVDWRGLNPDLRIKYDQWNAAHPDKLLSFPQFPEIQDKPKKEK